MESGEPDGPVGRRIGQGLRIYAGVLFLGSLVIALLGEYPFSLIAWGVAAVSAAFIAIFIVIPGMSGRGG
jgi:hypothetical protein